MIFWAAAAVIMLGWPPWFVARHKGHSGRLWWAFGIVCFPLAIFLARRLRPTEKALLRQEQDEIWQAYLRACPSCHDNISSVVAECPKCLAAVMPTRFKLPEVVEFRARLGRDML